MAILSTLNLLSEQRLGIDDMRRVESAVRNDFDTTVTSIFTNTAQGYIIRGFSIIASNSINSAANNLLMSVDPGAILHIDASVSGTIFQTPLGTSNQILNAAVNTNVTGSFTASATNYVGIDYNRFADPTTDVTKYIWNSSANDEITTIAPAAQTMTFEIIITTSVWAANVLPVAIVTTDSNGNVTSITDSRFMIYSLESGGINPNPNYVYPWSEGRTQPPVTITIANSSADPFNGGDKQLTCFKDWADAVMSELLEIKGTPYWFTGTSGGGPIPTLLSLFQDLGNTVVTGAGQISNGVLPNSAPVLVTSGNITVGSNQLTVASVAGLSPGYSIFGTGIPQGATIISIASLTITMSVVASLNGSSIGVSFYAPGSITTPGQINWNDPIFIRVIGSSLTYELNANPSSTDITLSDDQVAYITLIRNVPITPNLIFVGSSTNLVSVGNVVWTTNLLAGDYVKVASDTVSGYYQIATVVNGYQVTLATPVSVGDNTGPGGAQAQYAFGSYSAVATPSTTRDIYISSRETVPAGGNVFWLFLREDNGGGSNVYVRFLGEEVDNGQSVSVSGTTSLQLLQYIGSPNAETSLPAYTSQVYAGALPEITDITIGGGSTITGGQYFLINSSGNYRNYYIWFNVQGVGSDPMPPATSGGIEVMILTADSATVVATKLALALNTSPFTDFSATSGVGTVVVTNTSAGTCTAASNFNVGAPFAITTAQVGTGIGNYSIKDGDNLTLAIKELDDSLGHIVLLLEEPTYDEVINVVASGGTYPPSLVSPVSINGPISATTVIPLPYNSRSGNTAQTYVTGKGVLEVYLNGQFLTLGVDWNEVGAADSNSSSIEILFILVVGDELQFRININGGSGGLSGPVGPQGPQGNPGFNAFGGPTPISTKTSSYVIMTTDCVILADCTTGPITLTLPPSSGNAGRVFYVKKIDSSGNALTLQGNGSENIDQSNTVVLSIQDQARTTVTDGTQFWLL